MDSFQRHLHQNSRGELYAGVESQGSVLLTLKAVTCSHPQFKLDSLEGSWGMVRMEIEGNGGDAVLRGWENEGHVGDGE